MMLNYGLYPTKKIDTVKLHHVVCNKTILITGATYGIGEHTARLLACNNVTLLLVARTTSKLDSLKIELEQKGAKVYIYTADLYRVEDVKCLIDFINTLPITIDIFVSNAGKSICRSIFQSLDRFHDFTRTMSINYYAPVQLILALLPALEKNKGQIINISAINVLLAPTPYWAAYQASKVAFDSWVKCVAPELHLKEISITSIYLPLVRTRMIAPNAAYANAPAMQVQQAAIIICQTIIKRKRSYSPWWLPLLRLLSTLLSTQWEYLMTYFLKRK